MTMMTAMMMIVTMVALIMSVDEVEEDGCSTGTDALAGDGRVCL